MMTAHSPKKISLLAFGLAGAFAACDSAEPEPVAALATATDNNALHTRGSILDAVWEDEDGDGHFDFGERPLRNIRIYLDTNDNGVRDAGEHSTTTNSFGAYAFIGLAAGNYNIRQELPFGLRNTAGGEGATVTPTIV